MKTTRVKAHTVRKNKIPEPGNIIRYGGMDWVVLGEEQGGLLAIAKKSIGYMPFDENGKADWKNSTLRKHLNGEFLKRIGGGDGLMAFTSDLTADDGGTEYGTSDDVVFLLSDTLYRKYMAYIPKDLSWWWTITPWSTHPSLAYGERIVNDSGTLSYDDASYTYGVVPSLLFNLSHLRMTI